MIGPILAIAAMAAPAGYLAGSVYLEINKSKAEWLPYACAACLPLGAVIAVVVLTQTETPNGDKK